MFRILWFFFFLVSDSTVRAHYFKYFHPKEAMVGGGIVCASMCRTILDQSMSFLFPIFIGF